MSGKPQMTASAKNDLEFTKTYLIYGGIALIVVGAIAGILYAIFKSKEQYIDIDKEENEKNKPSMYSYI